jgi:hypothetical protein
VSEAMAWELPGRPGTLAWDTFMHNQKTNEELSKDRLLNVAGRRGQGSPHGGSLKDL